ncbi:MAG: endopeptidase La [Lentisphaerae bacterium]|nr:endopeptidase La [Lentisphaerota bacterium]
MAKKKKNKVHDAELMDGHDTEQTPDNPIVRARDILPPVLPILPVKARPLFPRMIVPVIVEQEHLKKMIRGLEGSGKRMIGIVLVRDYKESEKPGQTPKLEELHEMGVVAEILEVNKSEPNQPLQIIIGARDRFRITGAVRETPHIIANVEYIYEIEQQITGKIKAYSLAIINSLKELITLNPLFKEELNLFLSKGGFEDPERLADFSAALTSATGEELQDVLATENLRKRMEKSLFLLKKEIDVSKLQTKINQQIEEKLTQRQRQFFLREQLKAIKKELGLSKEGKDAELDRFNERLKLLKPSEEAKERIREEMEKLSLLEPSSAEFNVTRNYLDWLTSLPWGVTTSDRFDIGKAEKILDRDHYGLDDVKERILEFLSVGILKGRVSGSIITFVGPPGVGKTSIGKSIAESIGRDFYRFSLGGMRDEAEIKGHRRTYIGALPGKLIQALKHCKSANPLIMLDEVDKIGASFQGDPASALLEVLDPEQNRDFLDHYLDVRFDLSNILFVCTANVLDTIPRPLLDRMEVIELAGYILDEKLQIARKYLIPKQLKEHGIPSKRLRINVSGLREIIDGYAREPGVRGLENHIKKICRKTARKMLTDSTTRFLVDSSNVVDYLGKRIFSDEDPFEKPMTGVVTGLAWTSMGGDTIHVEANLVKTDQSGFKQTGQLGKVMIESSEIAYTFVRSLFKDDEEIRNLFDKHLIHLHVPAGATPKDGPSAGITMASSVYSLLTGRTVRPKTAMTGELTLSGLVMPVGGIKEKTLAAKRMKITNLIFPAQNRQDYEELPEYIRKGLKPVFVSTFPEVIEAAFVK